MFSSVNTSEQWSYLSAQPSFHLPPFLHAFLPLLFLSSFGCNCLHWSGDSKHLHVRDTINLTKSRHLIAETDEVLSLARTEPIDWLGRPIGGGCHEKTKEHRGVVGNRIDCLLGALLLHPESSAFSHTCHHAYHAISVITYELRAFAFLRISCSV